MAAEESPTAAPAPTRASAGAAEPDPVWARLEEQITWNDVRSKRNQTWYRSLKVLQIVTGALIPLAAGAHASAWVTGGLGSAVVNEGLHQLFRFHDNWVAYPSTLSPSIGRSTSTWARRSRMPRQNIRRLAQRVEALISEDLTSTRRVAAERPERDPGRPAGK